MTTRSHADEPPLALLLREVVEARAMLAEMRRHPTSRTTEICRERVLYALEAYTDALRARRLPVPYALRDELRLHQRSKR